MKVLRTPEKSFKDLKNYPYKPHYTVIESKRVIISEFTTLKRGQKRAQPLFAFTDNQHGAIYTQK